MGARGRFEQGASAVEYAILVAATAAVLVFAVFALKDTLLRGPMYGFCHHVTNPDAPASQQFHDVHCY